MKYLITIFLFAIILSSFSHREKDDSLKKEQPPYDIIAGTWKHLIDNEAFIVEIWKAADGYNGHYKKIILAPNGNQTSQIYNSNKPIGTTTINWPYGLTMGELSQSFRLDGIVIDNTVTNTPNEGGFIDGYISLKILNPNCFTPPTNNCPLQLQWSIRKSPGLVDPDEPDFNIPKNVILTKE